MNDLVDKLFNTGDLSDEELKTLLESDSFNEPLAHAADIRRRENYGDKVYIRGLIEFTNYCRNNCYYCGIRRDNKKAERYRLTKEEILLCCDEGYRLGFRTFIVAGFTHTLGMVTSAIISWIFGMAMLGFALFYLNKRQKGK